MYKFMSGQIECLKITLLRHNLDTVKFTYCRDTDFMTFDKMYTHVSTSLIKI